MPNRLKRLARMLDPLALCYGLGQASDYGRRPCDHTFTRTRALLADYAPDVDPAAYIAELAALGAHCDCEVGLNICPETGA